MALADVVFEWFWLWVCNLGVCSLKGNFLLVWVGFVELDWQTVWVSKERKARASEFIHPQWFDLDICSL